MHLTKSELSTKLAEIHQTIGTTFHVVFIQNKTGEVIWSEMPDNINLTSLRIDFETQQFQCNFSPLKPPVHLITIFRECYDQEDTCAGCRWYDKELQHCAFKDCPPDNWPEIINHCGYRLENKLW